MSWSHGCIFHGNTDQELDSLEGPWRVNDSMKHLGVFHQKYGDFTPQIIHQKNRVFYYKPSILGYHYFWKHPI